MLQIRDIREILTFPPVVLLPARALGPVPLRAVKVDYVDTEYRVVRLKWPFSAPAQPSAQSVSHIHGSVGRLKGSAGSSMDDETAA